MKIWLRIVDAAPCGLALPARDRADDSARFHADRPQHAGAGQRSAGFAGRPLRGVRAARNRPRSQPRPHRPVAGRSRRAGRAAAPPHAALRQRHASALVGATAPASISCRRAPAATQVWRLPLAGGEAVQITDYPLDVGTFRFSPDGERIALAMDVFPDCADLKCTRDRLDAAARDQGRRPAATTSCSCATGTPGANGTRSQPVRRAGERRRPRRRAGRTSASALDADVPSKPDRRRRGIHLQPRRHAHRVQRARRRPRRALVDQLRPVRSAGRRQRGAAEPDGRQPGLGHAARVPAAMATSPGSR